MKRKIISVLCLLIVFAVVFSLCCACGKSANYLLYKKQIDEEMKFSFDFFWNNAVTEESSPAYGIIADRMTSMSRYGSIACVGFGLTAYVIGVEEGYVTKAEAESRSKKTLAALIALQSNENASRYGFFYHFLDMNTGTRYGNCEVSSVDTAILICGAITAGEYFGGKTKELCEQLYANVDWKAFEVKRGNKTYISMAYENGGISSTVWDWYAEQLMIYVLGAGSPTERYRLDDETYYDFTRQTGRYGTHKFIYSYFGSIFTYQFSHAWIDFRDKTDANGTNWFDNSVAASEAAYEYCRDNGRASKTFEKGGWGLTACDAPNGYNGHLGTPPRGWSPDANYIENEGTVAPAGAIGSVVFTPAKSLKALKYYQSLERLNSKRYGLTDAYNLDKNWYASDFLGIDKGITLLMLANFKNETVWDIFMQNKYVNNGLEVLRFTEK